MIGDEVTFALMARAAGISRKQVLLVLDMAGVIDGDPLHRRRVVIGPAHWFARQTDPQQQPAQPDLFGLTRLLGSWRALQR